MSKNVLKRGRPLDGARPLVMVTMRVPDHDATAVKDLAGKTGLQEASIFRLALAEGLPIVAARFEKFPSEKV